MIRQITLLAIPLGVALIAVIAFSFFSSSPPFNGICRKCGENLPRHGFTRCPWCGKIALVLWYR